MPANEGMFYVVDTTANEVVLRALRDCTREEFLASLPVSKATRKRFAEQVVSDRVHAGQVLAFALEQMRASGPTSNESAHVLWRDRFALVAHKPAGLLVHGDGTQADTLTARVQGEVARMAAKEGWPFVPLAQAVNRLDVDTSGLVLFSLTPEFQPAFDALVASHDPAAVHKRYLAIVEGRFSRGSRTIDAPIARDRHDARCMRVGRTGKSAQTRVTCLDHREGRSLVVCELLTGRRHQIRVHLAHIGHPIVGDPLYGHPHPAGLMLHAHALDFVHPLTRERVSITTEWPPRFSSLFPPRTIDWRKGA